MTLNGFKLINKYKARKKKRERKLIPNTYYPKSSQLNLYRMSIMLI